MDENPPAISRVSTDECWNLLRRSGVGMLATAAAGRPDLFPVNYLVDGRTLLFRSAPGTKVAALEVQPHAAFGAQSADDDGHWSIVIRGRIDMLTDQAEIVGSGALELVSWAAGSKRVFMRLTPDSVEGRRVASADYPRGAIYS